MIDTLLLTATRIRTFAGDNQLSGATGFFFERDGRLYLVTNRHAVFDAASSHEPDRIEIDIHDDAANMAQTVTLSIPLYSNGTSVWRQGEDGAGEIDVAVVELDRTALPENALLHPFTPAHLALPDDETTIEIGTDLLAVGFPLGFYDTLHKLPVVRNAILASPFGLRFQGMGYFLTDARTHRGISGAPIVKRATSPQQARKPLRFFAGPTANRLPLDDKLPWVLVGIHSSSFDMSTRDAEIDDALGLNAAWYVDILMTLTNPPA